MERRRVEQTDSFYSKVWPETRGVEKVEMRTLNYLHPRKTPGGKVELSVMNKKENIENKTRCTDPKDEYLEYTNQNLTHNREFNLIYIS